MLADSGVMCVRRALSTCTARLYKRISTAKGTSSNMWLTRQLNDPYVAKAKRENYRSRAAYKLLQIQEKYPVIKSGHVVVDCGCAPGGWSQVAASIALRDSADTTSRQGRVIGVDVNGMVRVDRVDFIQGDFTTSDTQRAILQLASQNTANTHDSIMPDGRFIDVILSDMAPNASGVRRLDHDSIVDLCYSVLRFSLQHLVVGGAVLVKLWSGGRQRQLLDDLERFFHVTRSVKPAASRQHSGELYLLASGFVGATR